MFRVILIFITLALLGCSTSSPPANQNAVEMPKALRIDRPVYPYYAFKNHIEGHVKFVFDVDAEGKVSEMRISESTPDGLFNDTVIRAVNQWRFEKGHPTKNLPMNVVMRINRNLE